MQWLSSDRSAELYLTGKGMEVTGYSLITTNIKSSGLWQDYCDVGLMKLLDLFSADLIGRPSLR